MENDNLKQEWQCAIHDVSTSTIASEEHDRLLRYISYLQEKCDTIHWHYNKYERWCEVNDKH